MRIIAFLTEAAPVERILLALGEPTEPPPIAPARPGAALLRRSIRSGAGAALGRIRRGDQMSTRAGTDGTSLD
jgi:hypothetical protein